MIQPKNLREVKEKTVKRSNKAWNSKERRAKNILVIRLRI
jgi:hypothetical protein